MRWRKIRSSMTCQKKRLQNYMTNEIEEFLDDKEELLQKVKYIANAMRQSKHCVVYTGAGVSTRFVFLDAPSKSLPAQKLPGTGSSCT